MRVLIAVAAGAVSFAVAGAAVAQGQEAATPGTTADDEIICKYQSKTGTRFAKKVCRTKAHWDAMGETARREAAENFNKPTINTARGN